MLPGRVSLCGAVAEQRRRVRCWLDIGELQEGQHLGLFGGFFPDFSGRLRDWGTRLPFPQEKPSPSQGRGNGQPEPLRVSRTHRTGSGQLSERRADCLECLEHGKARFAFEIVQLQGVASRVVELAIEVPLYQVFGNDSSAIHGLVSEMLLRCKVVTQSGFVTAEVFNFSARRRSVLDLRWRTASSLIPTRAATSAGRHPSTRINQRIRWSTSPRLWMSPCSPFAISRNSASNF